MRAGTRAESETSRQRLARRRVVGSRVAEPLPYRAGIDGLRAIAVLVIVLADASVGTMAGSHLGVEILFVVTGFLLTSLLIAERRQRGRIRLTRFWAGRVRRTVPVLLTVIGGVSIVVLVARSDEVFRLGPEVRAALTGMSNWHLIFRSADATVAAHSPLDHLWSVAVGAQFVVWWPLAFALLTRRVRASGSEPGGGDRRVRAAAVLLAIAAAIATAGLALLGDTSRALHGSDTRASGLLLGAVVALALPPSVWRRHAAGARARRLRVLGLLVLAAMLAVIVAVAPYPRWVPRGGLFVVALLSAVLIAAVVRSAELDRLLGAGPLRWMGRRSFALYLWHWPVLVAIGGPAALPDARIVALYLAVSMVLADATHRFVEAPLRRVQEGDGGGRRTRASVAVGATAVACGVAMVAALLAGQGRPAGAGSAQRAWPFPYASRDSGGR